MDRIEVNANGKKIRLSGSNAIIEKEKNIIENLELTGNECVDRLIIQKCIDDNKLKSSILYDGNTVYPFEKIVKAYRRLQKSGSLENLTKEMYHFFMYACGDIAHYDIGGYKCYYDFSFRKLENELLKNCWTATRFSDIDKIFKELKIGRDYFYTRDTIDINSISLNKLKSIIKESGWNITNNNTFWRLDRNTFYNNNFAFDVDVSSNSVSNIVIGIQNYNSLFNKNEYIEKIVASRDKDSNSMTIREIVAETDNIGNMLSKLADDVLYKSRLAVEEKITSLNLENEKNNDSFEYEY